jgi:hypothetical protein
MGITECQHCGSRYAGFEEKCTHKGYFWQTHSYSRKYKTRKEAAADTHYTVDITQTDFIECNSSKLKWSLQKEYNKQEQFFSVVDKCDQAVSAEDVSFTGVMEWKDFLPLGSAESIENRALKQKIIELEYKLEAHHQVIKEIADRMQQAGHSLLYGSY